MRKKILIVGIIMLIMMLILVLVLSIYFQSQGSDIYEARTDALMIFWVISIIVLPIFYILFKLDMKKSLASKENSSNDEDK